MGTGKNVIIVNSLEKNKKYLILVPRIILMEQIKEQILKFNKKLEPKIQCLGDNNNEYDNKKLVTICVYNSMDKVENTDSFDKIFIDEAHHVKNCKIYDNDDEDESEDEPKNKDSDDESDSKSYIGIISSLSKHNNNVYLSATIDKIDNFEYYSKDIREMINLKYLCDYTINVPVFNEDITNKNICWHLIRNYSNIIIYCSNQKEGQLINETLNKLIDGCSNYIDCNTSKNKRDKIIKKYKEGKLTFLANVKILVEGFDSPITKGVCFMHLPSSKTALIQIIGRALRLHPLKSVAKIILPCSTNEDEKSINYFLKVMAKNDVRIKKSFENKCLGGYISIEKVNKDDINNNENNELIEARYEMIYDSFGELKNRQEIWDYKFKILLEFIEEHKRIPTNKETHKGVMLNKWLMGQKKKHLFSEKDDFYKICFKNEILKKHLDEYLIKKSKDKKIRTFEESVEIFENFIKEHKRVPKKNEVYNNYNIGQWYSDRKKRIESKKSDLYSKLSKNQIVKENLDDYFNKKDLNKEKEDLSFEQKFNIFKEYIEKNGKIPIKSEIYKSIKIGRWWGTQKLNISSKNDEKYKILAINNIIKNNLDENIKTKEENKSKISYDYEEKIEALLGYVKEEKKVPQKNSTYENINVGYFLINLKTKLSSKNDEIYKMLSKEKLLKDNLDEYLITKEKNKTKEKLSTNETILLLKEFVEKNNRVPKCKENYKNINIGNWLQHQKSDIESKDDEIYKKLSKNKILKENIDEYLNTKKKNKRFREYIKKLKYI